MEGTKALGGPASLENKLITCLQPPPRSESWSRRPIHGSWPSVSCPLRRSPNYLKHSARKQQCFWNSPVKRTKCPVTSMCTGKRLWGWFASGGKKKQNLQWWQNKTNSGCGISAFRMNSYTSSLSSFTIHLPVLTVFCVFYSIKSLCLGKQIQVDWY